MDGLPTITDAMVEAARAAWQVKSRNYDSAADCWRAALSAALAAGGAGVKVPEVPTEEMVVAGDSEAIEVLNDHTFALKKPTLAHRVYTAMLAARPTPSALVAEPAPVAVDTMASIRAPYTNWRGETADRVFTPIRVWWGSTEWHPEPGLMLKAFDHDKQAERDFAFSGFAAPPARDQGAIREALRLATDEAKLVTDPVTQNNLLYWLQQAAAALAQSAAPVAATFDLVAHLRRQKAFSEATFGPGARTAGVLDHIRKELTEIEADPADIMEWVDVIILAFDGAWRAGWEAEAIVDAIVAKQTRNEGRQWPDWRTAAPDKAIEHVRAPAPQAAPAGEGE